MLDSADLPESTDLFVSVRCANRMGLDAVSDNTNFIELDTALPHAGEIFLSSRRRLCALSHAIMLSPSQVISRPYTSRPRPLSYGRSPSRPALVPSCAIIWALTLAPGLAPAPASALVRRDLAARMRAGERRYVALCAHSEHADRVEWLRRPRQRNPLVRRVHWH